MRDCDNCKHRDVWVYADPCSKCNDLSEWKEKRPTNADRIRTMTDEEIEEWYWWMHKVMFSCTDSHVFVHNWLKQEVQDADD